MASVPVSLPQPDGFILSDAVAEDLLHRAYVGVADGDGHAEDRATMAAMGAAGAYGEIPFVSVTRILSRLAKDITPNDVFYDLGCGVGKFCLQAFLTGNLSKVVGLELGPRRHAACCAGREAVGRMLAALDGELENDVGGAARAVITGGTLASSRSKTISPPRKNTYSAVLDAAANRWTVVSHANPGYVEVVVDQVLPGRGRGPAAKPSRGQTSCVRNERGASSSPVKKPLVTRRPISPNKYFPAAWHRRNAYAFRRLSRTLLSGAVDFRCEDILKSNLADASIVYCASALFPTTMMRCILKKLAGEARNLRWVLTLNKLPEYGDGNDIRSAVVEDCEGGSQSRSSKDDRYDILAEALEPKIEQDGQNESKKLPVDSDTQRKDELHDFIEQMRRRLAHNTTVSSASPGKAVENCDEQATQLCVVPVSAGARSDTPGALQLCLTHKWLLQQSWASNVMVYAYKCSRPQA